MNFNDYMAMLLLNQLGAVLSLQTAIQSGGDRHHELNQAAATMSELAKTIAALNDCKATAIDPDCLNTLMARIQLEQRA